LFKTDTAFPAEISAPKPYTAPRRTIWLWGVGAIADTLMIQTFGLVMQIYNTGFGVSSVMLGWALMLPRLIDALGDPLVGHLSDNANTRWGRRKPFLVATTVLGAVLIVAVWWANPQWSDLSIAIFLAITATLYYCNWGTYSMAHTTLGFELSDDYHERSRVIATRTIYVQLMTLAVGWTYWLALRPVFGGEIHGIRWIAVGFAAVILVTGMVPAFVCTERFAHPKKKHPPLWGAIRESLSLPAFRTYLLMRFFWALGTVLFAQMIFYVNVYYVCQGNKDLATKIGGIGMFISVGAALLIVPLIPRVSRHIGKRRGIILGTGLALAQALAVPFLFTPSMPYLQLVTTLLAAPLITIAIILRDAIVPDICDVDELTYGHRREGLFSSVVMFVYKLEVSVCIVIVGYLVSFSGFDPKAGADQPEQVLTHLRWYAFAPNIVCAAIALFFALRFPLTEAKMREVTQALDDRRRDAATPLANRQPDRA
jgi:glycoside/pentoside/hexuronide:cation symporter, GPH family